MDDADRNAFGTLLFALGATFRVEVTKPMNHGYWLALRDLTLPQLEKAVEKAVRACKFMPVPAELRELGVEPKALRPYHLPWPGLMCAFHDRPGTAGQARPDGPDDRCAECRHVKARRLRRNGEPTPAGQLVPAEAKEWPKEGLPMLASVKRARS